MLDRVLRRVIDVVVAAAALLATAPAWPVLALAVRLGSKGPLLHVATRVGRDGRPIRVHKFRTMVESAAATGPGVTAGDDRRVTRTGRWLRATKLDELPQLLDVLAGRLALVGPRPEDPRYVAAHADAYRPLLAHRPGLVSPATIAYRDEEAVLAGADDPEARYLAEVLPAKLEIDAEYFARRTVLTDLGVLLRAARAVVSRGNR